MKVITIPKEQSELNDLLNSGYDQESINNRFHDDLREIAREYTIMAELKGNANIIYSEDIQQMENPDGVGYQLFIKMELLQPLNSIISNPASEEQVIKLGMDMCNALAACRRHNIIHRDIKPQNILVSKDGNFKLGDFGVSKTAERTAGGTKTGTYNYMAPEVYNNKPYGAAVDIYSLGMVLYWMLNRRRAPFLPVMMPKAPTARQVDEANQRRFKGDPLPPPVDGNPALHKVVLKACAFRAEDRYSTPEEMYAALLALKEPASMPSAEAAPAGHTQNQTASSPSVDHSWTDTSSSEQTMGNDWGQTDEKTMGTAFARNDSASGGTVGNEKATGRQQASAAANVTARLEITPEEAKNGCRKKVMIEGREYEVPVMAGMPDKGVLKVHGAGKIDAETGAKGDAFVVVSIRKATEDFWKAEQKEQENKEQEKKKETYLHEALITANEAKKGKEIIVNGRKIMAPPGTKDGDIIDSVRIYVFDAKNYYDDISPSRLEAMEDLPDIVLKKYVDEKWTIGTFIGSFLVVAVLFILSTVFIPLIIIPVLVIIFTPRAIKHQNLLAKRANEILEKRRKNG